MNPKHTRAGADRATADRAEGADYARALLERIGAGTSSPEDLASLLQFLHSGDVLHGFAVALFAVLSHAAARGPAHDRTR